MRQLWQYLLYLVRSRTRFDVHSPFLFDLINQVIRDKRYFYAFDEIEAARADLKNQTNKLIPGSYGATSRVMGEERDVSSFVRKASIRPKYGRLLFRLINYYQPETILEIGTGLGISTAYMALAKEKANLISLEGEETTAAIARNLLQELKAQHVRICEGDFVNTLPSALQELQSLDFAFIDGNHRFDPTIRYFDLCKNYSHSSTILVFDDIHWSKEMERAWEMISSDPAVTLSIDMFFVGLVFFRQELSKNQVIVRY